MKLTISDNNNQLQGAKVFACNTSNCSSGSGKFLFTVQKIVNSTHSVHFLNDPVVAQSFGIRLYGNILTICELILYSDGNMILLC
jgi:hypothetical protein